MSPTIISGNIVDVVKKRIFPGTITIENGSICNIQEDNAHYHTTILPGFIDAHIHIESSMIPPAEFSRLAVVHGTVATVSDPHEIANVLGIAGVRYMIENGKQTPFKFYFGAPSCVPATSFETAGASLGRPEIEELLQQEEIKYLSEMMNYPGVIHQDPLVMDKIAMAKKYHKPIDGHIPGIVGEDLQKYIDAGISTDHETYTKEEAIDKLQRGMKIQIREGSAAKNFDALSSLIDQYPDQCFLCSDDKHPDDLVKGHINELVRRAFEKGLDTMNVLRCASYNPVLHYGLDVGLLQKGDPADFIVVNNLKQLTILQTYIKGFLVAEKGKTLMSKSNIPIVNNFHATPKQPSDFHVSPQGSGMLCIHALDGQLVTEKSIEKATIQNGNTVSNTEKDILKIAVVNRYVNRPPAIGFIKNMGLQRGAIASSVAHDSHHIIVVGVTDEAITKAVNAIIEHQGGLAVVSDKETAILPLPIAGLMSDQDGYEVARQYAHLQTQAKSLGSSLRAPFMTLAFMALLVIPKLKLSDQGLFDGEQFRFTNLFISPTESPRE
jgi:adenine deaminase